VWLNSYILGFYRLYKNASKWINSYDKQYIYIQFEVNFSSSFTISYLEKYTFQALIVEVFEASIMQ
jgi:hypothetical protein